MKPARSQFTILQQICNLITGHLVSKLAQKHGVEAKSRSFTPWSHVVSLLFAQFSHALSLNDVCDTRHHVGQALALQRQEILHPFHRVVASLQGDSSLPANPVRVFLV